MNHVAENPNTPSGCLVPYGDAFDRGVFKITPPQCVVIVGSSELDIAVPGYETFGTTLGTKEAVRRADRAVVTCQVGSSSAPAIARNAPARS